MTLTEAQTKLAGAVPQNVINELPSVWHTINTPLRLAHFLAQTGHESAGFTAIRENLNYSASALKSVFGKYFKTDEMANKYARKPEMIANLVYANRMGNGNEASGDGWKFRGRGYIQLTGTDNYRKFDATVTDDIMANPDLVASKYPLLSAEWFWTTNKLNAIADLGDTNTVITQLTKRINNGTHGLDDRTNRFNKIYSLLTK